MKKHQAHQDGNTPTSTGFVRQLLATSAMTMAGILAANAAMAAPTPVGSKEIPSFNGFGGMTNVPGNWVSVGSNTTTGTLTVNQNAARAVLNWNTFNLGKNATATFTAANAAQITVNRVVGNNVDPSRIYGKLTANNRIFILDKNGVFFDKNAQIDVGGLVASTGDLANINAFVDGTGAFALQDVDAKPNAKIDNEATINVAQGGLLAFVAPYVSNSGTINAKLGKVTLASGSKVTVDLTGDELISIAVGDKLQSGDKNKARIDMDGKIYADGGTIAMTVNAAKSVVDTAINMDGVAKANSFEVKNGKIVLNGMGAGKVKVTGDMYADRQNAHGGVDTAGSVEVTGAYVDVKNDAQISASGLNSAHGGVVRIFGTDKVVFSAYTGFHSDGYVKATGGSASGNGGSVSISSGNALTYEGTVDTSADHGTMGTLTIDPATIAIWDGYGSAPSGSFSALINARYLATTLGLSNVHVIASDKIALVDDIDLSRWWFGSLVTTGNLTLESNTVDLTHDLEMGKGDLFVDANTVNLDGKLYNFNGSLLDRTRIGGTASVVNVLSDDAKVQQGVDLAGTGATVYVGVGEYGENVDIYKSLTLQGVADGDGDMPLLIGQTADGAVVLISASNVTVNGFEIVGKKLSHHHFGVVRSAYGIYADGVENVSAADNLIRDMKEAGIYLSGVDGASLVNNTILSTAYGMQMLDVINATASGNRIGDTTLDGIYARGGRSINLYGNTIEGTGLDGIDVANAHDVTISGNTVSDSGDDGIDVADGCNVTISGNTVTGVNANGIEVTNSRHVDIYRNTIGEGGFGPVLLGFGGEHHDKDHHDGEHEEEDDEITGIGEDGIHIENGHNTEISGNFVNEAEDDGISVENSHDTDVTYNTVNNVGDDGILSRDNRRMNIEGNRIGTGGFVMPTISGLTPSYGYGSIGDDGIDVENSHHVLIGGNTVSNANDDGIDVEGSRYVSILENTVSFSGDNGIEVDDTFGRMESEEENERVFALWNGDEEEDGDEGVEIAYNDVYGAGTDGIQVDDSDAAYIHDNTVTGAGRDGIHASDSDDLEIRNNTVYGGYYGEGPSFGYGALRDGIHVEDSEDSEITGNSVLGNYYGGYGAGRDGIHVVDTEEALISGNTVSMHYGYGDDDDDEEDYSVATLDSEEGGAYSAGRDGIHVEDSEETAVSGNGVYYAQRDGIHAFNSEETSITGNSAYYLNRNGIYLENSDESYVGGNTVYGTSADGIHVLNSDDVTVYGNSVYYNSDDGINVVDSDGASVDDNYVYWSSNNGIEISGSNDALVNSNDVLYSYNHGISVENGEDIDITSNYTHGYYYYYTYGDGIHAYNVDGLNISNNSLYYSGNDGIDVANSSDVKIDGNYINNSYYYYYYYGYGDGIHAYNVDGMEITSNYVYGSQNDGIDVASANDVLIRGNTVAGYYYYYYYYNNGDGIRAYDVDGLNIANNHVYYSGNDGIEVGSSSDAVIDGNYIDNSYYYYYYYSYGDGIRAYDTDGVQITNNTIYNVRDDSIEVEGSENALISGNYMSSAWDAGVSLWDADGADVLRNTMYGVNNGVVSYFGDGIVISGNHIHGNTNTGIGVYYGSDTTIAYNTVQHFYDGIEVYYSTFVDVVGNTVSDIWNDGVQVSYSDAVRILGNVISGYYDDGIQVSNSGFGRDVEIGPKIAEEDYDDGYGEDFDPRIIIADNTIDGAYGWYGPGSASVLGEGEGEGDNGYFGTASSGIRLWDNENGGCSYKGRCIEDNSFQIAELVYPYFGIMSGNGTVDVTGNTVSNNQVGLDARAFNNGRINIAGNSFIDNAVGAWIGSGLIDLTGDTNTFTGGDVALRFERATGGYYPDYNMPVSFYEEEPVYTPDFAYLELVDDTLGTTVFEGQSTYYVDLQNGAFFDPGKPTIIDGTLATYDGVSGGLMTPAQLAAIEAMINDYDDNTTLGQIFAGYTNSINDSLLLRRILGGNYRPGRAGIVITGLPSTNGGGGTGLSVQDLADLAPAAGGEDDGELTVEDLANLAPAAGGEGGSIVHGACWNQVGQNLGGSTAVNMDLDSDPSSILADQSACGGGDENI